MIHLMKLELRKTSIKRYLLYSIIGIILGMFFVFVGLNDTSTKIYDYKVTFRAVGLVFCFYYIILFAELNVNYIINEYSNRTIFVLFSYPVNKRKLILAKLLLITALMFLSMVIGYLCCCTFIVVIDNYSNLVMGDFHISILSYWIPAAMKSCIMFCLLGICTFIAGMVKKSVPITLVSSIIFIYIRQFLLAGTNSTEESWFMVFAVAAVTVIGVHYILQHKVME